MMKDNRLSIIMCCNNTHQGAPHTRTLTEFAKKCAVHATPGQSLRFGPRWRPVTLLVIIAMMITNVDKQVTIAKNICLLQLLAIISFVIQGTTYLLFLHIYVFSPFFPVQSKVLCCFCMWVSGCPHNNWKEFLIRNWCRNLDGKQYVNMVPSRSD